MEQKIVTVTLKDGAIIRKKRACCRKRERGVEALVGVALILAGAAIALAGWSLRITAERDKAAGCACRTAVAPAPREAICMADIMPMEPIGIQEAARELPAELEAEPESRYPAITEEDRELLAKMVYLEARGESAEGQQAVAEVTMNRVVAENFPDTVWEVLYQKGQYSTARYLETAEPTEAQYRAVDAALAGAPILPPDVVFFSTKGENDNVWGTIGGHIFCYLDCISQVMWAGAGGALSGAAMGGTVAGLNYATVGQGAVNRSARKLGGEFQGMGQDVVQAIVDEGLQSAGDTESHRLAVQAQEKLARGEELTRQELGRLYQENVAAMAAEEQDPAPLSLPRLEDEEVAAEARAEKTASGKEAGRVYHGEILDTVREHLSEVRGMESVATLTGDEFQRTEGGSRSLRQKIIDFFNSLGNKVTRPGMGDIALNAAGARDSVAHGYGRLKAATFAALPSVLENGALVKTNGPYEGHDYNSYLIAAPVSVGGETCYVGALVIQDEKTRRYKLHEVLTTDESGTPLFKSETAGTSADGPLRNGAPLGASEGAPTDNIMPEVEKEVKGQTAEQPDGKKVEEADEPQWISLPRLEDEEVAAEAGAGTETGAVRVGRATTIRNLYEGDTPTYIRPEGKTRPMISSEILATAKARFNQALRRGTAAGNSFRNYLNDIYDSVFQTAGGQRGVAVAGLTMNGKPYIVTINKNAIGKVISDKGISAEKLAVLDALDEIIENGEYVGSGRYIPKGGKIKQTTRFDYFESPVTIAGDNFLVKFDVEVFPGKNNYRTHRVINEMDLIPVLPGEAGTYRPQSITETGPSTDPTVPQAAQGVKTEYAPAGENDIFQNNEPPVSTTDGTSALAGDLDTAADTGGSKSGTPLFKSETAGTSADGPQWISLPRLEDDMAQGGPEGAMSDDRSQGTGAGLPDGGRGRIFDTGAGEHAGSLAAGTQRGGGTADQGRAAVERQNRAKGVRAQRVSSRDLGIDLGTDTLSVTVMEEAEWDDAMRSTAQRVRRETGKDVTYVLGGIEVRTSDGAVGRARGVYTADRVIIQADNLRCTIDQIADHEIFHDKASQTPGLIREIEDRIQERYDREEFAQVVDTYIQRLKGVIDVPAYADAEAVHEAYLAILEEIFADAYAGINAFAAHAERYNETVERTIDDRDAGRAKETSQATDRTTGPPDEGPRFSINDEKRTIPLLRTIGLHGPIELQQSGLSHQGQKVSIEGVPFSDVVQESSRSFQDEIQRQLSGGSLQKGDLQGKMEVKAEPASLDVDEEAAVLAYKSSWSYKVNAVLRDGEVMDQGAYRRMEALDRAIRKLPVYQGTVYRRLSFDMGGQEALDAFLAEHQPGSIVGYPAYTSTAKTADGYPVEGELAVTLVIEGKTGRDLAGYGNNDEAEVLFGREGRFYVDRVETGADGRPVIYMEEAVSNGAGQLHSEERGEAVQQVQARPTEDGKLQGVPRGYSVQGADKRGLPGVRGEGTESVKPGFPAEGETWDFPAEIQRQLDGGDLPGRTRRGTIKTTKQEWRQIQAAQMQKYAGVEAGDIPETGTVFAHDRFYLLRNHGLGEFEVMVRLDPATQQAKINTYLEDDSHGDYGQFSSEIETGVGKHQDLQGGRDSDPSAVEDRGELSEISRLVQESEGGPDAVGLSEKGVGDPGDLGTGTGRVAPRFSTDEGQTAVWKEPENDRVEVSLEEEYAVLDYKSSGSYKLNEALRDGAPLDQGQYRMVKWLDKALPKLPVYQGTVYRRMSFDLEGKGALAAFLAEHQPGELIQYPAFTSASTRIDGYPVEGELTVTAIIRSESGRDLEGFGNNAEQEIVFPRNSMFLIDKVEMDETGKPVIYMREVRDNGAGQLHSKEQHARVQQVQEATQGDGDLRAIPGMDPQGETSGQVSGLRADGRRGDGRGSAGQGAGDRGGVKPRFSTDEGQDMAETEKKKKRTTKPVAESLPIIAKRDLRQNLLGLFSIPAGQRQELGSIIDQYADRLLRDGSLKESDREDFFDRMYNSGVMEVAADEYYKAARDVMRGGRIYVSDQIKGDFGDDWAPFRKRAFAAGIYLTGDMQDAGVDAWNADLASMMPGLFDAENLDGKDILEHIVQAAEEGKDEQMRL